MKKTNFTLLVFTVMSFVLAMTAFVFSGILDKVALSLGISVADSGLLNTMYSYGAAFGVPITLILFRKIERSRMLKIMLFATILMTFALIYAQSFVQMLIVRLLMGISANSYGVLAISTVVSLSPKERQGRSMAFYFMGSSLALVIGIPLTRALSSILDWRSIFWILNGMMLLSLAYFMKYLPKADHASTKLDLKNELQFFQGRKNLIAACLYVGHVYGLRRVLHLCHTVLAAALPFHRTADEPDIGCAWSRQFHGQSDRRPCIGCHRIRQVADARGCAPNGSDAADPCLPTGRNG